MQQMEFALEDDPGETDRDEVIMTATEVAKMLGVTSAAISHWCGWGYFPNAYKINPRKPKSAWRIPKRDVDAFIEERRRQQGFFRMPVEAQPEGAREN